MFWLAIDEKTAMGDMDVTDNLHPAAPHHLPWFITAPGGTDSLFTFTTLMVIGAIVGLGILFFTLHSLPERMGHKKLQFEVVAVLGLLSLFTHNHTFWVAGLLLALIDLPDFATPLKRMAGALEKLSGSEPAADEARLQPTPGDHPAPPADDGSTPSHSTAATAAGG
jgi:hypothetical protein